MYQNSGPGTSCRNLVVPFPKPFSKLPHYQTYLTHNYTSSDHYEDRITFKRFWDTYSSLPSMLMAVSIITERYHHGVILTGKKQHKSILTHDQVWNQHFSMQLHLFTIKLAQL